MKRRTAVLAVVVALPVLSVVAWVGLRVAVLESEHLQHDALEEICAGGTLGIQLAKVVFPSGHAHFNEEVAGALSAALQVAPERVLDSFGADYCFPPDDHLPKSCNIQDWKAASLRALGQVSKQDLAAAVSTCRTAIEAS